MKYFSCVSYGYTLMKHYLDNAIEKVYNRYNEL